MERRLRGHGILFWTASAVAAVAAVAVLGHLIAGSDVFGSITAAVGDYAYLAVFLSVFGDAIIPVLPGETALNAASTLAAAGELQLGLVMLAGALGAILGDSTLYWIARLSSRRVEPQIAKAKQNEKVGLALDFMGSSAPMLIVLGRYVPGLRFVVNATMGTLPLPLRPIPRLVDRGRGRLVGVHVRPRVRRRHGPLELSARLGRHLRGDHHGRDRRDLRRDQAPPA